MRKGFLLLCLVGTLLFAPTASADILVGSSNFGWQTWGTSVLDENGSPYWDNTSWDGQQMNIGYYLTKTGAFSSWADYEHPGAIPYWGNTSGQFDTSFYFQKDSAYTNAVLKIELAGYKNFNQFGWYDVDTGFRTTIFSGPDSGGDSAVFTPSDNYGFYLINKPGDLFLTQAGLLNSAANFQHFAVFFQDPKTYWIGIEDLLGGGDKDYNDMVIKLTSVPVPEPATMLLLGFGLIGLAGLGRRFKR